jgi:hypothetical protein
MTDVLSTKGIIRTAPEAVKTKRPVGSIIYAGTAYGVSTLCEVSRSGIGRR